MYSYIFYTFFLVPWIIFEICSLFLIPAWYKKLKLRKLIKDTPTSTIRSIPMGMVEVKGKAYSIKNYIHDMIIKNVFIINMKFVKR